MDWLLRLIGENWGATALLLVLPFAVWAELSNFPLTRARKRKELTK